MSAESPEQLTANVFGRKYAEELLALAESMAIDLDELARPRFWETILATALQRHGVKPVKPVRPVPFTDQEAIAFERQIVPFGRYQGERVGEVPIYYWTYITEGDFNQSLVRYFKSEYYQRRQEHGE